MVLLAPAFKWQSITPCRKESPFIRHLWCGKAQQHYCTLDMISTSYTVQLFNGSNGNSYNVEAISLDRTWCLPDVKQPVFKIWNCDYMCGNYEFIASGATKFYPKKEAHKQCAHAINSSCNIIQCATFDSTCFKV